MQGTTALKDATYKDKFHLLQEWMPYLIDEIKKDLKNDHLRKDPVFMKKYFQSKNLNKLTLEELTQGYQQALANEEAAENIGEFLANRWMLKHTDLYNFFEEQLSRHYPDFTNIQEIDPKVATELLEGSILQFGAPKTYLFSIINSVVFPQHVYAQLLQRAKAEAKEEHNHKRNEEAQRTAQESQRNSEQVIARLTDKYEKKLQGLQKKYLQDTEGLKKQIAQLQRKLNG